MFYTAGQLAQELNKIIEFAIVIFAVVKQSGIDWKWIF